MSRTAALADLWSRRLNHGVEVVCVALLVLLVLDVWLGVLVRHVLPLPLTFTEELARYLMIWMALLAISCGIVHREHIGVSFVFVSLPPRVRRVLALAFDLIAFVFFLVLLWYGIGFVERGFRRLTMIGGMPKAYPFMGVPLAAAVACAQLLLVGTRDALSPLAPAAVADPLVGLSVSGESDGKEGAEAGADVEAGVGADVEDGATAADATGAPRGGERTRRQAPGEGGDSR